MEIGTAPRRPPAASDAEIRAYLLPRLLAGQAPTYRAMRAELGGGGNSRLVRIRKQIERELVSGEIGEAPAGDPVVATELVATLEVLFERQWKALEEWEHRSLAQLKAVPTLTSRTPATKAKGIAEATSAQADRLEAVERRLMALLDKLQHVLANAPAAAPAAALAAAGGLEGVPPAWARQAAVAATAALDGRMQSMEETVRDAAAGARGAFDLAAEIAREVAADASLQLQEARSTLGKPLREEFANPDRSGVLDGIHQDLRRLRGQVGDGFSAAATIADRRAVAIRDVILAMVDIEDAQCDMLVTGLKDRQCLPSDSTRSRRRITKARRSRLR